LTSYTQTITDYVLGEAVGVTKEELFNHLRACKQCREEFFNWEDFYAVLRTEAHDAKPEVKERCQALVEEFKRGLQAGAQN